MAIQILQLPKARPETLTLPRTVVVDGIYSSTKNQETCRFEYRLAASNDVAFAGGGKQVIVPTDLFLAGKPVSHPLDLVRLTTGDPVSYFWLTLVMTDGLGQPSVPKRFRLELTGGP